MRYWTRGRAGALCGLLIAWLLATAPGVEANAPQAPSGCIPSDATFTQSTPVAVPTGPAVVTSTLVVSNAATYLQDLDATTLLTHGSPADVDMTLTSPAGTVVTLTTDNGGSNDDVFNGTLWDDDANPVGQVPYVDNNGLATDHAYANNTLASPLVPEEAMGAFIGEDPNGTWTLTISDDAAGTGGSLNGWSLSLKTLPAPPSTSPATTYSSTQVPIAVPSGPAVVTSTLTIPGGTSYLADLDVTTSLTHAHNGDIDMTLTSPTGTVVTLTTDNATSDANVFNGTVWDDDANPAGQLPYTSNNGVATDHAYTSNTLASPLVPEEAMAGFIGENPTGMWTLTISDDNSMDAGSLNGWSLTVTPAGPCPPTLSIADASVGEGDSGTTTQELPVTLSRAVATPVTVDFAAADGTATHPDDYASTSGSLTFAPGQTTKSIPVVVGGDTLDEPDETVGVDLSGAPETTIVDGHGVLTIADDDEPIPALPGDTTAPETAIDSKPRKKSKKKKVKFEFSANEPGASFACAIDGVAASPCTSPLEVKVKRGKHTFTVAATDAAGNKDASPATYEWKRKRKKRRHHHN